MATGPIGSLYLEAQAKAQKKASRSHESVSSCNCSVTVSWFSEKGHTAKFDHCADHKPVKPQKK